MTPQSCPGESGSRQSQGPDAPLPTRERILAVAHGLFQQYGFGRVGVDAIAATAGVTKRTLYHHFRSKDDLLAEVAGLQSSLGASHLRKKARPADAGAFVEGLFDEIGNSHAISKWTGVGFTRIALELTHLPGHPGRAIARRHKADMEAWLSEELQVRDILDPAGVARDILLLLEGCLLLTITHGDRAYVDRAADTARLLVETRRRSVQAGLAPPSLVASGGERTSFPQS